MKIKIANIGKLTSTWPHSVLALATAIGICATSNSLVAYETGYTWNANDEYREGFLDGESYGNPAPDASGNLVWTYEYTDGSGEASDHATDPWFRAPTQKMIWDTNDRWVDLEGSYLFMANGTVNLLWTGQAIVRRWTNPTVKEVTLDLDSSFDADIPGPIIEGDVDIAMALETADGGFDLLAARNFDENTATTDLNLSGIVVGPGETLIFASRCNATSYNDAERSRFRLFWPIELIVAALDDDYGLPGFTGTEYLNPQEEVVLTTSNPSSANIIQNVDLWVYRMRVYWEAYEGEGDPASDTLTAVVSHYNDSGTLLDELWTADFAFQGADKLDGVNAYGESSAGTYDIVLAPGDYLELTLTNNSASIGAWAGAGGVKTETTRTWNRDEEWTGGTINGATTGNPDDDNFGVAAWRYFSYYSGGGRAAATPWYTKGEIGDATWSDTNSGWETRDALMTKSTIYADGYAAGNQPGGISWMSPILYPRTVEIAAILDINPVGVASSDFMDLAVLRVRSNGGIDVLHDERWSGNSQGTIEFLLENIDVLPSDQIILTYMRKSGSSGTVEIDDSDVYIGF